MPAAAVDARGPLQLNRKRDEGEPTDPLRTVPSKVTGRGTEGFVDVRSRHVQVVVVLLMCANVAIALGHPRAGASYVIPWGTILVIVRRVLQGNWPAAIIIAAVWIVAVLILQVSSYYGW